MQTVVESLHSFVSLQFFQDGRMIWSKRSLLLPSRHIRLIVYLPFTLLLSTLHAQTSGVAPLEMPDDPGERFSTAPTTPPYLANSSSPIAPSTPPFASPALPDTPWWVDSDGGGAVDSAESADVAGGDLLPLFAMMHEGGSASHRPPKLDPEGNEIQGYYWQGLLWQSFAFFGVENSFRLMTDPYFRYLTADKPFWHDYVASLHQWNMGRWSDGDDFLVAYVGHPLQGSVTEFIEIQNDPHARYLQISRDPAYWKSRFQSFLWATIYSTDQKVGPLGETALGSEGGYTYPLKCPAPCPTYQPGLYKVTNNTGWVKFVTTPVVGTLWTLAEDTLDRYVSDRVQGDNMEAVFPKILRGSLNPSRTMANALRGHKPWYRDYQHPENADAIRYHILRDDEELIQNLPRYEIFPHFHALSLPVNANSTCYPCRQITTGPGIGFTYLLSRWWDVESDVDHHPNASTLPSVKAGGDALIGTFGLGLGFRSQNYGLKASVRPGFVSYDRAYFNLPTADETMPPTGRITHFATSLSVTGDYGVVRHLAMRASVSNLAVRYDSKRLDRAPGVGTEPYLFWISPKVYATNENWSYQVGPVLRF